MIIFCIFDEVGRSELVIMGELNVDIGSHYHSMWESLCTKRELIFSDIQRLPPSFFTHVENATPSCSWLDHCVCSNSVGRKIEQVFIRNEYLGSDYFPLTIVLKIDNLPVYSFNAIETQSKVNWNFAHEIKCSEFYERLYS